MWRKYSTFFLITPYERQKTLFRPKNKQQEIDRIKGIIKYFVAIYNN